MGRGKIREKVRSLNEGRNEGPEKGLINARGGIEEPDTSTRE